MKKGHRRTHSETITISRPLFQRVQQQKKQQQKIYQGHLQFERVKQSPLRFLSIQSLLQKSEKNITQRVLYIENLQQPSNSSNSKDEFSFGKGFNFKLNNFKLNMREIPEVPKSNQSTSHQGQNRIQNLQKQLYFAHEPQIQSIKPEYQTIKGIKVQKQIIKLTTTNQRRTKTASTALIKPINKLEKIQKNQKNQPKNTLINNSSSIKQNPLKRPKLQYQTHKKNVYSFGGGLGGTNGINNKNNKQLAYEALMNDPKKKKKNYVI